MLDRLKVLDNQRDVPYQSLLKIFVAERLVTELEKLEGFDAELFRPDK